MLMFLFGFLVGAGFMIGISVAYVAGDAEGSKKGKVK